MLMCRRRPRWTEAGRPDTGSSPSAGDARGDSLSTAVRDEYDYPQLFRLHGALQDVLTWRCSPSCVPGPLTFFTTRPWAS